MMGFMFVTKQRFFLNYEFLNSVCVCELAVTLSRKVLAAD